jgi:Tol biopolymer transport system component
VSGDINGKRDVFLVDRLGGHTIQDVTIGANGHSQSEQLSEDGNYILFDSLASNLVSGDTNNNYDVFVYDVKGATYTRASVTNSGAEGNNESDAAGISADGRYVAFDSLASNLVSGDTNGKFDIFIRDLTGGTTELVSQDSGVIGNGDSANAAISGDGKVALYQSDATNLVASDTNGVSDVFVSPTGGVCSTY